MSNKLPSFNLHPTAQAICNQLLQTPAFASQSEIESEAAELLVLAHAATAKSRKVASYLEQPPTIREVVLKYMTKMDSLGLIGNLLVHADPLAEFDKDPQVYVDQLVGTGVFESFDDFAEQAICLMGWGWTEISLGKVLCSVDNSAQTYNEWTLPLSERMKNLGLIKS